MIEEVLDLRPGETRPLRVILGNGGTISGRLFDSEGAPVPTHRSASTRSRPRAMGRRAHTWSSASRGCRASDSESNNTRPRPTRMETSLSPTSCPSSMSCGRRELNSSTPSSRTSRWHEGASFDGVEVRFPIPRFLSGTIRLAAGGTRRARAYRCAPRGPDGAARMGSFPSQPMAPIARARSLRCVWRLRSGSSRTARARRSGALASSAELDLSAPGDLQRTSTRGRSMPMKQCRKSAELCLCGRSPPRLSAAS